MAYDKKSFQAGLTVGATLKGWASIKNFATSKPLIMEVSFFGATNSYAVSTLVVNHAIVEVDSFEIVKE